MCRTKGFEQIGGLPAFASEAVAGLEEAREALREEEAPH